MPPRRRSLRLHEDSRDDHPRPANPSAASVRWIRRGHAKVDDPKEEIAASGARSTVPVSL